MKVYIATYSYRLTDRYDHKLKTGYEILGTFIDYETAEKCLDSHRYLEDQQVYSSNDYCDLSIWDQHVLESWEPNRDWVI
jgi:hypothetical protein